MTGIQIDVIETFFRTPSSKEIEEYDHKMSNDASASLYRASQADSLKGDSLSDRCSETSLAIMHSHYAAEDSLSVLDVFARAELWKALKHYDDLIATISGNVLSMVYNGKQGLDWIHESVVLIQEVLGMKRTFLTSCVTNSFLEFSTANIMYHEGVWTRFLTLSAKVEDIKDMEKHVDAFVKRLSKDIPIDRRRILAQL